MLVRSSLRGYLAVEPFFLAGASSWLVSIGAVVLRNVLGELPLAGQHLLGERADTDAGPLQRRGS